MKILCVTPAYYPAVAWGGPIISVHLLNRELVKLGHSVTVLTTTLGLAENKTQKNMFDGVEVIYLRSWSFGRWFIPRRLRLVIGDKLNNFDMAHIHMIWDPIGWLAAQTLMQQKKKYIVSPRGSLDPLVFKKHNYALKTIIYRLFIKKVLENASGFHFTSIYEQEKFFELTKLKKSQSHPIIFNPLDLTEFQKVADKGLLRKWRLEGREYFLYLGRLSWKKGIDKLIEAFAIVNQSVQDIFLVIAGPDEAGYKKKLETLTQAEKLGAKIIFTGLVQGESKLALLKQARAFILPSYSENFGMAVAEAMAAGVPVIISSGVGLKDLIEKYNAGLVFNLDRNPEQNLFEQMRSLIADSQLRLSLIENGRKLVQEQFNPQAVAEQMLRFYSAVRQITNNSTNLRS